jgi:hypothetical protein
MPVKQGAINSFRRGLEYQEPLATPLQQRPATMPEYALWREHGGRSPQSIASTPSMMDSSSMSSVGRSTPVLGNVPISPLVGQFGIIAQSGDLARQQSLVSSKGSPSSTSIPLHPLGLHTAYAELNGIQVPGIIQAASNEGDSLNLNNLGGDGGQDGGGYDQGGYGGDGHGGYGGDDHYGDHGNGGYGPPGGGNGAGGSGGEGNDPGEGPPPPPKGKKLQLACHFCRRRKLK